MHLSPTDGFVCHERKGKERRMEGGREREGGREAGREGERVRDV